MKLKGSITDVSGLHLGHAQDPDALTGCTVILCENGATGGVDQRGGAPGTRETDALHPLHIVTQVHAVVLTGGSAFGLDSASGVVAYLEERGVGFDTRVARVPIVPAAVLFDLGIGRADIRPGPEMGYQACLNAHAENLAEGNVGAGTGATVGKILSMSQAMKSGIGMASEHIGRGVIVAAIAAVNAFGDVIDPTTNKIIAGARAIHKGPIHLGEPGYFADTMQIMRTLVGRSIMSFSTPKGHTVIGVVATNAKLNKEQVTKVAQMAHDGIARTIRPAHTMLDGDTIFTLATGDRPADVNIVGAFGAEVFGRAILNAVRAAQPAAGLPASGV